ncbi:MAG: ATP-binding protein [Thermodesulfobacteriota bacterium]|nr:ATP-binding protein [Thermodesulfobacteriota bacterium]
MEDTDTEGTQFKDIESQSSHAVPVQNGWKSYAVIFGLLILFVLAYFYWQIRHAEKTFIHHVREHTRMLADVIMTNAKNTVLSRNTVEEIIETFLGNSARFIDYLDDIEPFSSTELAAYAAETGLTGIRIIDENGTAIDGPAGWSPFLHICNPKYHSLSHLRNKGLYVLALARSKRTGCIVVGLTSSRIEKLQDQIGLPHFFHTLSSLPGIKYLRLESETTGEIPTVSNPDVEIFGERTDKWAEARLHIEDGTLVVGLEAKEFFIRENQLWNEFLIFGVAIVFIGAFSSCLLFRYQNRHLSEMRSFERKLAAEKEDAALGRASSTITHEIRNPLNAISMGLQRLRMEGGELTKEHLELVSTLLKAVQRTNSIIEELRRYAMPLTLHKEEVSLDEVIRNVMALYSQLCVESSITMGYQGDYTGTVPADRRLLEEVVENLFKNAMEAQNNGGYITIRLSQDGPYSILSIENGGFRLSGKNAERIMEPYFTTKTRGTGLGLPIIKRIVDAHQGYVQATMPEDGVLRIDIYFLLDKDSNRTQAKRTIQ